MTGKLMPVQSFPRCVHAVGSGPAVTGGDSRLDEEPIVRATGLIPPPAHFDPPMGFARDPAAMAAAVAFVLDHPARFVFLAVGSPAQERLAEAIAATGRARGVGLCIGAGLAFLAGAERRAPRWMQMAGLEWLFRLVTNPRRLWRRYLCDSPAVLRLLLRERLARSADAGA